MAELISVIVTTYNREDALDAVLRSLAVQSDTDFEIVVADDGSGPGTARTSRRMEGKTRAPYRARLARGSRVSRRGNSQSGDTGRAWRLLYLPGW